MPIDNNPTLCNSYILQMPVSQLTAETMPMDVCKSITFGFWADSLAAQNAIADKEKTALIVKGVLAVILLGGEVVGTILENRKELRLESRDADFPEKAKKYRAAVEKEMTAINAVGAAAVDLN